MVECITYEAAGKPWRILGSQSCFNIFCYFFIDPYKGQELRCDFSLSLQTANKMTTMIGSVLAFTAHY